MANLLDHNLLLQIVVVLLSSAAFFIILESFGYATLKPIWYVLGRREKKDPLATSVTVRIFIGGLSYTLAFFFIGLLGFVSKSSVIVVSCLVPLLAFVLGRRWHVLKSDVLKLILRDNKYPILGGIVFMVLTFILWFRPVTNFDAVWYHLEIPKLFLQNHNVNDQGKLLLYSLQPALDYFWNLWPLSLPVSTVVAGIIINSIQAFLLAISLVFVTKIASKTWLLSRYYLFALPVLLGTTYETLRMLGGGGNDILGLAYGLVAVMYCFYLLRSSKISWYQFTCGLLLIVGLATTKIFFTLFGIFILAYLLVGAWPKLPRTSTKRRLVRLVLLMLVIFLVTYLPWLIRSYQASGRVLDPIGEPTLSARTYLLEGGGTALNHWTKFIYERFYSSIWPILLFVYSPLVLIGVLSIAIKSIRDKVMSLWLLAVFGFVTVFFITVALNWRYFLPQATVLVLLGVIVVKQSTPVFDLFGKLVVWGFIFVALSTSLVRVVFAEPDGQGYPSINQNIYILHFSNSNDYLRQKLGNAYDYVQQSSPADLAPNEKIFIGNSYLPFDKSPKNLHDLSYINNPVLEPTINKDLFGDVHDVSDFIKLLEQNNIKYLLTKEKLSNVCLAMNIKDYMRCDDSAVFAPVFRDNSWETNWYKIAN